MIWARTLVGCLMHVVLVLALAPLAEGVRRRLTARVQSRQGPPLLQPYFDLLKLLAKEDLDVGPSPLFQRFAAGLSLAAILAVSCLVPFGDRVPFDPVGDVILLVYLLTLCGTCTLLAGFAAGSTYSLIGVSREMATFLALEPLLATVILAAGLHARSLQLDGVLHGALYDGPGWPWAGLLLLGVMLLALPAFAQRAPFDVAEAETELMDGPLLEYSGPKLAALRLAQMARLLVYAGLVVSLCLPRLEGAPPPLRPLVFWIEVFGLVAFVTLIAASHARHRIDQAVRRVATLLGLALAGLVLASLGL